MNAVSRTTLPDIQASSDPRNLAIQQVGVKSVRHPIRFQGAADPQQTIAEIDMFVSLPAQQKGTHMSRFLEALQGWSEPFSVAAMPQFLAAMIGRLQADAGSLIMRFPYFVAKTAPVSGVKSLLDHQVTLTVSGKIDSLGTLDAASTVTVTTPVTSLCPCSKEISRYGAHNQRSHITISATVFPGTDLPPETLIGLAESAASCEIWGLLKRPDEKYVTERAYENPKFVEDLVRDIALALAAEDRVAQYEVASENFESIHNHSAFAVIRGPQ